MSWQQMISAGYTSSTWGAVVAYADERIVSLTKVCVSPSASVEEIRVAQAAIAELNRLKNLPASLSTDYVGRGI